MAKRQLNSVLAQFVVWLLVGYQRVISPMLAPRCRFYPTCSSYAIEAIILYGVGKGSWLAAKRLMRCHPWGGCGVDFVPRCLKSYQYVYISNLPKGWMVRYASVI